MAAWHEPPRRDDGSRWHLILALYVAALFGVGIFVGASVLLDAMNTWPK